MEPQDQSVKQLVDGLKKRLFPVLEKALKETTEELFTFAEHKIKNSKTKYDDVLLVGIDPLKRLALSGIEHMFHKPQPEQQGEDVPEVLLPKVE